MQRLFSAFPDRGPGAGLLLLRAAVGATLVIEGSASLMARPGVIGTLVTGSFVVLVGVMLVVGVLTPLAGVSAPIVSLLWAAWQPGPALDSMDGWIGGVFFVMVSLAIALLGPGAFSLDAYLFGRREIVIPTQSRPSRSLSR